MHHDSFVGRKAILWNEQLSSIVLTGEAWLGLKRFDFDRIVFHVLFQGQREEIFGNGDRRWFRRRRSDGRGENRRRWKWCWVMMIVVVVMHRLVRHHGRGRR